MQDVAAAEAGQDGPGSLDRDEGQDQVREPMETGYMDQLIVEEPQAIPADTRASHAWPEPRSDAPVLQHGGTAGDSRVCLDAPCRFAAGCSVEVQSSNASVGDFMEDLELFDFRRDRQEMRNKRFSVPFSMQCIWRDSRVKMAHSGARHNGLALLQVLGEEGRFWLDPSPSCRCPWLVVRDAKYLLAEGDVLRVGRFSFRIRQLVPASSDALPDLAFAGAGTACSTSRESLPCRICLHCGPDEEGPLVAPCRCRGSIEHVHLGCLRHWIRSRCSSEGKRALCYRPQSCELCKAAYPTHYEAGGRLVPLVAAEAPRPPYLVLEERAQAPGPGDAGRPPEAERPGLYVASLAEGPVKLGRCHESDIEIPDDYVSRRHAVIRFESGRFLLEDNRSRWGTLVALRDRWQLRPEHAVSVQVGPVVLTFSLQPRPPDPLFLRGQLSRGRGRPLHWPPGLFDGRARALWLSLMSAG